MIPFWTAQENDCKNNIKSINQPNQQSTKRLNQPTNQTSKRPTESHWPIEQPRSSDSSENGRILTTQVTYLRAIGSQQIDQIIDQTIGWTQAQVQKPALRSELVRALDQVLEVRNRPGANCKGLEDLGGLGDWCKKIKSRAIPNSIC